ncbi:hypothetical protein D3C72_2162080 [compost metagenome]
MCRKLENTTFDIKSVRFIQYIKAPVYFHRRDIHEFAIYGDFYIRKLFLVIAAVDVGYKHVEFVEREQSCSFFERFFFFIFQR